jgi:hypothetical protein
MNKLFVAGCAGFLGALTSIVYMYLWQWQIDVSLEAYGWSVVLMAVAALAGVAYWYGLSIVGTRYGNSTLHYMALLALILSVLTDASGALYTLAPQYAASSGWDAFGLFMGTLYGLAYILAGLAVQKMRQHFGDAALWYGIFAMLSGIIMLAGDFGIGYITTFGMVLNIVLYVLGGMILLQAAKK